MELFEAKWTELPDAGDTVNLDFVRNVVGKSRVAGLDGNVPEKKLDLFELTSCLVAETSTRSA